MADLSESIAPKATWARPESASKLVLRNILGIVSRFFRRYLKWRRVLYIQYTNPGCYPPLQHSSQILASAGCEIFFLGTESFGSSRVLSLPPDPRIRVTKLSFPSGGTLGLHYLWYCWRIMWGIFCWRPAWLYASDILSCPPALMASIVAGVQVIFHEHDAPSPKHSAFSRFLFWSRTRLARRASLNILPSASRAQHFQKETQATVVKVVWNCPSVREIQHPKADDSDSFVIYYHGNISPSLLPIAAVTSLKFLPDSIVLRIVGYETVGSIGYTKDILKTAASLGFGLRVFVEPPVPRFELLKICRQGDAGLALFPKPTGLGDSYAGASNKVFDYLCCGMPVIVPDSPEWKDFFYGAKLAIACNPSDPKSIAEAVLWLYTHRKDARLMGDHGRERIRKEWNYEEQFRPVLKFLTSNCDASSARLRR